MQNISSLTDEPLDLQPQNLVCWGGRKKYRRFQYTDRPMAKIIDPKNFPGLSSQNIRSVEFIFFHSLFIFFQSVYFHTLDSVDTVLKKKNFPPHNRQNIFFLPMRDKLKLPIGNLLPKSF